MEQEIKRFIDSKIEQRDYNTALRLKWLSISDLEESIKDQKLTIILLSTIMGEGGYTYEALPNTHNK